MGGCVHVCVRALVCACVYVCVVFNQATFLVWCRNEDLSRYVNEQTSWVSEKVGVIKRKGKEIKERK